MNEDHSVEDLLRILGKGSSEPKPVYQSKLEDFIKKFDIRKGSDRIPTTIIWYTYKEVFKGSMSKIGLFRELNKSFDRTRTGRQRFYKLNKESFDLSREGLIKADFFNKG